LLDFEAFIDKLQNDSFLTLETTPRHSASIDPILDRIEELALHEKVDGFSVTDSPLAKMKYSSLFATIKLQEKFKKPTLATMSMRDKNKIALQSDLLGANDCGVRSVLALTGDSANASDQPNTKGVFEGNSTMLLDIIKCFNGGIDYAGQPLDTRPSKIYPFAVSNAYAKNPKNLINPGKIGYTMNYISNTTLTAPSRLVWFIETVFLVFVSYALAYYIPQVSLALGSGFYFILMILLLTVVRSAH